MRPHYKINIITQAAPNPLPDEAALKKAAKTVLALEGLKNEVEVNILFTDDKFIRDLNKRFLNRDEPTDVVSFNAKAGRPVKRNLKGFIGDVVISTETAGHNAKRFNTTTEKEILLYVVHGLLHLLGYTDETKKAIKIIQGRQGELLEKICRRTA